MEDLSNRCTVLCAPGPFWRGILSPGLAMASLRDGRSLDLRRVDPDRAAALRDRSVLDGIEVGALVVVDLVDVAPSVFAFVEWLVRARPSRVLLFRRGTRALPFELRSYLVRSLGDAEEDEAAQARLRVSLGTLATLGAAEAVPARAGHQTPRFVERLVQRRERLGVAPALREASRALLDGRSAAARDAMADALERQPKAPDLLLRAAILHRVAGQWGEARSLLKRAVRRNTEFAPAWRELGIVQLHDGDGEGVGSLKRAVELSGDFEASLVLASQLGRDSQTEASLALLERAMRVSGGQLNLVLPTLEARAHVEHKLRMSPLERQRLDAILAIRRAQADADPAQDAPWSHFDVARASLFLGDVDGSVAACRAARAHLSAPWQTQTLERSLEGLEGAGCDVAGVRDALGLLPASERPALVDAPATPPYRAAARAPGWFVENVPCLSACPVGTDAGAYVHLIAQGRFEEAFHVARGPNPLTSVCGRICAAPCEDACRRGHIDEPVQIRSLKRFLTERHGVEGVAPLVDSVLKAGDAPCIQGDAYVHRLRALGDGGRRRAAVIGGGPAGLACAHDLAVLGHSVTIIEATHQLGGMMRQGIPIYRLSRDLLELEIGAIRSLGVQVELGQGLSAERTLDDLLEEGFDAVFLATGTGQGRSLEVEGAHFDGVVLAIDYLLNANQGYTVNRGRRVVVVGGGNVALDVARTARLGRAPDPLAREAADAAARDAFGKALPGTALRSAFHGEEREVHVIARQPMGEWPAQRTVRGAEELEEARREGVSFHPLRGVRRFLGSDGKLTAVELAEVVELHDATGAYAPRYGAHAAEVIPCDTAFLAVGQKPRQEDLAATPGLKRNRRGLIEVDAETLTTSMPQVFAGGDAVFGPRTLIEAVRDGKRAARSMHRLFSEGVALHRRYLFRELPSRAVPPADDFDAIARKAPPHRDMARRTGIAEVESCFDATDAVRQAERCLVCHAQTIYDGDLCIACGRCTDVCPYGCLSFVPPEDADLAGVELPGLAASIVLMLKDEEHCIRCGLCAERCPTGAMTMEQFQMHVGVAP